GPNAPSVPASISTSLVPVLTRNVLTEVSNGGGRNALLSTAVILAGVEPNSFFSIGIGALPSDSAVTSKSPSAMWYQPDCSTFDNGALASAGGAMNGVAR